MFHLVLILHLFIGATLSGVGVVVVLLSGFAGSGYMIAAIVAGFVLAFPAAHVVAKAMRNE